MSGQSPSLDSLAAEITKLSGMLTDYMRASDLPAPSFEVDSPAGYGDLPPEIFSARQLLLDALTDMWFLTWGPAGGVFAFSHTLLADATVLNIMNEFDFWSAVPLDGTASYEEIAERTNLPVDVVRRVIRHALNFRFFAETDPGDPSTRVKHTALSGVLVSSAGARGAFQTMFEIGGGPTLMLHQALSKYNVGRAEMAQGADKSAFALFDSQHGDGKYTDYWQYLENSGEGEKKGHRQKSFSKFMDFLTSLFGHENVMAQCYDWKSLGAATVVDVNAPLPSGLMTQCTNCNQVGGSGGHNAIPLAQNFLDLRVVVEDLPRVRPVFEESVPPGLRDRVSFLGHDFFDPQPERGADVYVFKKVFHDWPDESVVRILRAQVPALRPGARVLVIEHVVDRAGLPADKQDVPRSLQRLATATDLRMMALFNAKERSVADFRRVLGEADDRFELVDVKVNPKSELGVFEIVWRG
ncbi:hypothetical protein DL764_003950 [Monosporascus ibericus]|uniref:O-methyltransferase C-terminal domain-containing protein n=1 Tax=Monosporascus ibericus TaxID=155417 RepID=A0A4Q4TJ19_9PEZI|nr:hypothetical protein DL764_003950 [Monosporascus ibericus]